MEKLVIEHPGTRPFIQLAEKIRMMLEFDLNYETDTVTGKNDGQLTVMTEDGMDIFSTNSLPTLSAIKLYVSLGT